MSDFRSALKQFLTGELDFAGLEAALQAARIRVGYADVEARWAGDDAERVVAERFVDEGQTVTANTPLFRIVSIDPLSGVFFVTEKDYANLQVGQRVDIRTDAYPGEVFKGRIERIAPVFQESSRQARVEISVANLARHLKPGMFARIDVEVGRVPDATIVPAEAIVTRADEQGVFVVAEDGTTASWRSVEVGIREGERVQVSRGGVAGRVIVLGQQLVEDGSPIRIGGDLDGSGAEAR